MSCEGNSGWIDNGAELTPDQPSGFVEYNPGYSTPMRSFETQPPRTKTAYSDFPVDVQNFFEWFYQFDDQTKYPIKLIVSCYKRASMYVTKFAQCDQLDGADREYARGLMCAHLIVLTQKLETMAQAGQPGSTGGGTVTPGQLGTVGVITNASVGGVSVGAQLPTSRDAWEFWLNQTPYGLEFQAFLSSHVAVGVYSEGDDLRSCFRD